MKKAKLVAILALSLVLGLALVLVMVTYAQGPEDEEEGVVTEEGVGGLGLADPPPAGYSVLYMFTGVANDYTAPDYIATVVFCTNFGSSDVDVEVQMFDVNAAPPYTATRTIQPSWTRAFASLATVIYSEDEIVVGNNLIYRGSGRVVATGSDVICTAQLVDPNSALPSFISALEMYRQ